MVFFHILRCYLEISVLEITRISCSLYLYTIWQADHSQKFLFNTYFRQELKNIKMSQEYHVGDISTLLQSPNKPKKKEKNINKKLQNLFSPTSQVSAVPKVKFLKLGLCSHLCYIISKVDSSCFEFGQVHSL